MSEVVVRNICLASVIVFCIAYSRKRVSISIFIVTALLPLLLYLPKQKPLLLVIPRTRACVGS